MFRTFESETVTMAMSMLTAMMGGAAEVSLFSTIVKGGCVNYGNLKNDIVVVVKGRTTLVTSKA